MVYPSFARELENELADMKARAEKAEAELARLRAENKLLRAAQKISEESDGAIVMECISLRARAEKAEAEAKQLINAGVNN
jgi:hypothetical protein